MSADIDDDFVADKKTRAAVIQGDLDRPGSDKSAAAHDQFSAARLIGAQVEFDFIIDHVLLAATYLAHVGSNRPRRSAEVLGIPDEMGEPRAPELVLGRQAGDGGT